MKPTKSRHYGDLHSVYFSFIIELKPNGLNLRPKVSWRQENKSQIQTAINLFFRLPNRFLFLSVHQEGCFFKVGGNLCCSCLNHRQALRLQATGLSQSDKSSWRLLLRRKAAFWIIAYRQTSIFRTHLPPSSEPLSICAFFLDENWINRNCLAPSLNTINVYRQAHTAPISMAVITTQYGGKIASSTPQACTSAWYLLCQ